MKTFFKVVRNLVTILIFAVYILGCSKPENNSVTTSAPTNANNFTDSLNGFLFQSAYADSVTMDTNHQYYFESLNVSIGINPTQVIVYIAFSGDTVGTYPASSITVGSGNSYVAAGPYPANGGLCTCYAKTGSVVITKNVGHLISGTFKLVTDSTNPCHPAKQTISGHFTNVAYK